MTSIQGLWNFALSEQGWIVHVFTIVVGVLLLDFIQRKIINRLITHAETKTANLWDDAILGAAKGPISIVLWMLGLLLVSKLVFRNLEANIADGMYAASHVGIVVAVTWFLSGLVAFLQKKIIAEQAQKTQQEEGRVDKVTIVALCKLLRLAIMITAGIVILETLGFSISGVLAFGGIGGIAVGFAAKDLLSNFFGGLMIYLDRPFTVGDWICSPDRNIEGTVEYIGWRQTRIRTFAKRPIYIPNSIFSTIVVENPSRMSHRRIYETFGIRYDDVNAMASIVAAVETMLKQHPEIDTTQTLIVNFNSLSDSSVDFFVYTFTKTTNWVKYHQVKQDVLLQITDIVQQHGGEFAFPTSTLHIEKPSPQMAGLGEMDAPKAER